MAGVLEACNKHYQLIDTSKVAMNISQGYEGATLGKVPDTTAHTNNKSSIFPIE